MAIATSLFHRSLSGAVGDLIFRNYNGKTVVSVRPIYKNQTNTEARRKARGNFRDATGFAINAMEDPRLKAYYKQKARQLKLPNAYTAAITDYLRKAKAAVMTHSTFAAKKGDVIRIRVSKSVFRVNNIKAILCSEHGEILSEQKLTKRDGEKTFAFTFTNDFPNYAFFKIITDEPGIGKEYKVDASTFLTVSF